jgi:hypothetical protein
LSGLIWRAGGADDTDLTAFNFTVPTLAGGGVMYVMVAGRSSVGTPVPTMTGATFTVAKHEPLTSINASMIFDLWYSTDYDAGSNQTLTITYIGVQTRPITWAVIEDPEGVTSGPITQYQFQQSASLAAYSVTLAAGSGKTLKFFVTTSGIPADSFSDVLTNGHILGAGTGISIAGWTVWDVAVETTATFGFPSSWSGALLAFELAYRAPLPLVRSAKAPAGSITLGSPTNTWTTPTINVAADELVVAAMTYYRSGDGGDPTVSGLGATWTSLGTLRWNLSGSKDKLTVWWARPAAAVSGQLTFTVPETATGLGAFHGVAGWRKITSVTPSGALTAIDTDTVSGPVDVSALTGDDTVWASGKESGSDQTAVHAGADQLGYRKNNPFAFAFLAEPGENSPTVAWTGGTGTAQHAGMVAFKVADVGAAPTFVEEAVGQNNGNSTATPTFAAINSGDFLVALVCVAHFAGYSMSTVPTGWTLAAGPFDFGNEANWDAYLYAKIAGASEDLTPTWVSTGSNMTVTAGRFTGVSSATPVASDSGYNTGSVTSVGTGASPSPGGEALWIVGWAAKHFGTAHAMVAFTDSGTGVPTADDEVTTGGTKNDSAWGYRVKNGTVDVTATTAAATTGPLVFAVAFPGAVTVSPSLDVSQVKLTAPDAPQPLLQVAQVTFTAPDPTPPSLQIAQVKLTAPDAPLPSLQVAQVKLVIPNVPGGDGYDPGGGDAVRRPPRTTSRRVA